MKVRDTNIRQMVDVADRRCLQCPCYWPRPDPGSFTQGQGYRRREGPQGWLCGRREINGCPTKARCCERAYAEYETKCRVCGRELSGKEGA